MKGSYGFGLTMNGFENDLLPHLHKKGNGRTIFCLRGLMSIEANMGSPKKRTIGWRFNRHDKSRARYVEPNTACCGLRLKIPKSL
jgi:hypothetical protein